MVQNIKRLKEIASAVALEKAAIAGGQERLRKMAAELEGLADLAGDAEFDIDYAAKEIKSAINTLEKLSGKTADKGGSS